VAVRHLRPHRIKCGHAHPVQFFRLVLYHRADNIYHRGPLYWFPVTITSVLTAAAFILVISNHKKVIRKHFISLLLFPVPPIVCIVLQITYYGTSLILNGAVLSILIAFVTIQNERMNTDYLTGVFNRKGLRHTSGRRLFRQ
jgi:energy-converting hydrogenase Eha subunit A